MPHPARAAGWRDLTFWDPPHAPVWYGGSVGPQFPYRRARHPPIYTLENMILTTEGLGTPHAPRPLGAPVYALRRLEYVRLYL